MAKRQLVERAREFRVLPTVSEKMLWDALRDRKLHGVKFRRQVVIGRFVVDLCAPAYRLIVEIDGGIHMKQREHDAERQRILEAMDYRVLRIPAHDVETKHSAVHSAIIESLFSLPSPSPSPHEPSVSISLRAMERGPGGEDR